MLENMFVGRPPGNYDRLLDFSRAVTGTLYFIPSVTFLEDAATAGPACSPAELSLDGDQADDAPTPKMTPADGSLGIGSLKGKAAHE